MYHVITKDGAHDSYVHPTVSTVTGGMRKIWQVVEGEDTAVREYATADILATVDCQHPEEQCVCVETVLAQLTPSPPETEAQQVARKLRAGQGEG